jgi:hypothetical protein
MVVVPGSGSQGRFSRNRRFAPPLFPLDSETAAHYARSRKTASAERDRRQSVQAPLIGPHDAPINVVGGYPFPKVPKIDLSPIVAAKPVLPATTIGADVTNSLDIPEFLLRRPENRSPASETTR